MFSVFIVLTGAKLHTPARLFFQTTMRKIILITLLALSTAAAAQPRVTHIHVHGRGGTSYTSDDGTSIGLGVIGEWRNLGTTGVGINMKIGIVDVAVTTSLYRDSTGSVRIIDPFNADSTTNGCVDFRAGIMTQDRHAFGIIAGLSYEDGERSFNYGAYYRMYLLKTATIRPSISVAYTRRYGLALGGGITLVLR